MSRNIEFKKEFVDLVNELTCINPSIAIMRDNDRIVISQSDKFQTLPYILTAPANYFNIDDTIAFYKFSDFHRHISIVKESSLSLDSNDSYIYISIKGMKIKYRLSLTDGVSNGPKEVQFGDGDAVFTLTKEDLDEIVKINNLIKGDKARIRCSDNKVTITFSRQGADNTFEKEFVCERVSDFDEDFEFDILANRFEYIPCKKDYTIYLSKHKYVKISLMHEDIELNIYSGDAS
jgi:hypothetical protein